MKRQKTNSNLQAQSGTKGHKGTTTSGGLLGRKRGSMPWRSCGTHWEHPPSSDDTASSHDAQSAWCGSWLHTGLLPEYAWADLGHLPHVQPAVLILGASSSSRLEIRQQMFESVRAREVPQTLVSPSSNMNWNVVKKKKTGFYLHWGMCVF